MPTTTAHMELTKDAGTEQYSVSRVNANSDKIDAYCYENRQRIEALEIGKQDKLSTQQISDLNSINVAIKQSTDSDNPTYGTPTASNGIVLTLTHPTDAECGLKICACTSGEIFVKTHSSSGWSSWVELVGIT